MRLGRVGGHFGWEPLNFGWTLADVIRNREAQGSTVQQLQKSKNPARRALTQGDGSRLAGLMEEEEDGKGAKDGKSELEV